MILDLMTKGEKVYLEELPDLEIFSKKNNRPDPKSYQLESKLVFVITKK